MLTRAPRVGDWYTFCCEEDLAQIHDEQELAELLEEDAEAIADDEPWLCFKYFATYFDAIDAIGNCAV